VAMEDWASLDALFSYRVCAVSFTRCCSGRRPPLALRAPLAFAAEHRTLARAEIQTESRHFGWITAARRVILLV